MHKAACTGSHSPHLLLHHQEERAAVADASGVQAQWKNIGIVCEGSGQQRDRGCEGSDHLDYVWMRLQLLPPEDRFPAQKWTYRELHSSPVWFSFTTGTSLFPPRLFFITPSTNFGEELMKN